MVTLVFATPILIVRRLAGSYPASEWDALPAPGRSSEISVLCNVRPKNHGLTITDTFFNRINKMVF